MSLVFLSYRDSNFIQLAAFFSMCWRTNEVAEGNLGKRLQGVSHLYAVIQPERIENATWQATEGSALHIYRIKLNKVAFY